MLTIRRPRPREERTITAGTSRSVSSDSSMKSSAVRSGDMRTARPGVITLKRCPSPVSALTTV